MYRRNHRRRSVGSVGIDDGGAEQAGRACAARFRQNRLLFTGDTFYLGPIYLYVPETDVAAYEKSLDRLARLVPQLDILLPAHNVAVAEPQYLARARKAFADVKAGRVKPVLTDGYREYRFDGFSLLLSAA